MPLNQLKTYAGISIVSGDGLIHELINGIFSRPDWEEVAQIPIGPIPGGSGNAMVASICHRAGEPDNFTGSVYLISKGNHIKTDLMVINRESMPPIYSFLTLTWGYIADIDVGSNWMRWIGPVRYDLYGFWRGMFQKKYKGTVWIKRENNKKEKQYLSLVDEDDEEEAQNSKQDESQKLLDDGQWEKLDESFKYFVISKMPFIGEGVNSQPLCRMDDGYLDFEYLTGDQSWWQLIKLGLNFEKGNHFDLPNRKVKEGFDFKYQKIKAFKLEPHDPTQGNFAIDGEDYRPCYLEGQVKEKCLNIFCTS